MDVFPSYLSHMSLVLSNFLWKQWHEKLEESQIQILLNAIKTYLHLEKFPTDAPTPGKYATLKIRGLTWRDWCDEDSLAREEPNSFMVVMFT